MESMTKKLYENFVLKEEYLCSGIVVPLMVDEVIGVTARYDVLKVAIESDIDWCTEIKVDKQLKGQAKPGGVYMGRLDGIAYYAHWTHSPTTEFMLIWDYYEKRR